MMRTIGDPGFMNLIHRPSIESILSNIRRSDQSINRSVFPASFLSLQNVIIAVQNYRFRLRQNFPRYCRPHVNF